MWVAFKLLTFFSAKNIRILYIESAKTVNEMTLNQLNDAWTTGPRCPRKSVADPAGVEPAISWLPVGRATN